MAVVLDRACIRAGGPDAAVYLQSMVSNDVASLEPGGGVYALLLTPKARVIADLEIYRLDGDLVLACAPDVRDEALQVLLRSRFRRNVELEPTTGAVVWGEMPGALARLVTPIGDHLLLPAAPEATRPLAEWEIARIEAGIPRFGREFDRDSMPAEGGLVPRAVSFTKGCYPGQEPVARLHHRGHANRGVRGLALVGKALPDAGAELESGGRPVGRVTSAALSPRVGPIALAVVRREVQDGDIVEVHGGLRARVVPLPFAL